MGLRCSTSGRLGKASSKVCAGNGQHEGGTSPRDGEPKLIREFLRYEVIRVDCVVAVQEKESFVDGV